MTSTLHEAPCTYIFLIKSHSVLLRMRTVSDRTLEKIKTHFMFSNFFFFWKSYRAWDNLEKYPRAGQATDDNTRIKRRMRIACWIPTATNAHSAYVILIACPRHQWCHERASMLHYTYIACPVVIYVQSVGHQSVGHQSSQSLIYLCLILRRFPERRKACMMAGWLGSCALEGILRGVVMAN
jgi:hypothetical protein